MSKGAVRPTRRFHDLQGLVRITEGTARCTGECCSVQHREGFVKEIKEWKKGNKGRKETFHRRVSLQIVRAPPDRQRVCLKRHSWPAPIDRPLFFFTSSIQHNTFYQGFPFFFLVLLISHRALQHRNLYYLQLLADLLGPDHTQAGLDRPSSIICF